MNRFSGWIKRRTLKSHISDIAKILGNITSTGILGEAAAAQQGTEAYWLDPSFLKWLNINGVQWEHGKVPKYSDGGVGRAYFLGNKVVKFTDNMVEANVANMVANNHDTPTRINSVYRIPGSDTYAILQDKVNTNFPKTFGQAADILMAYVDEKEINEFPSDPAKRKMMADEAIEMFDAKPYLAKFILEMMNILDKLYRGTGFFHDDAMPQNLGLALDKPDDFEPVVFDLGPNQPRDFNPRTSMDKIHNKRRKLGLPSYEEI